MVMFTGNNNLMKQLCKLPLTIIYNMHIVFDRHSNCYKIEVETFLLSVVDAYSAWCGPCKAIVSSFKRIKNELGDDLLVFATVSLSLYLL